MNLWILIEMFELSSIMKMEPLGTYLAVGAATQFLATMQGCIFFCMALQ